MSNVAHVKPQRRLGQKNRSATAESESGGMASGSSVSIVQNGVVRRIIVPSAAGKSATPVGEVTQIFGAELTPAMVASTSQARKHPANQFIGSHISASANVGTRSLSPSLVQARNQLTNALASNKVYLTTSQGVGSLSTLTDTTQLPATAISGVQVAIPAATVNSVSGQYPVVLMQEQQPVLIQGQQSPRMLFTHTRPQVVMTAQGKQAVLVNNVNQGRLPSNTAQWINSRRVRPGGPRILYQVPAQTLQTQVSPNISFGTADETSQEQSKTSIDEEPKSFGNIQIGSVFSLKDKLNSPYNDFSKVITIEPDDSDETINVEDEDSNESTIFKQSGMYTQSEILNFDSSQQQEYQVLAEWDKESSEGDSASTGANTETSYSQAKSSPHSLLQTTVTQPGMSHTSTSKPVVATTSGEAKKNVRTVKEIVREIWNENSDSAVKTNSSESAPVLVKDILYGKGQKSKSTENSAVMMTTPSSQKSVPFVKDILSGKIQLPAKSTKQSTVQVTTSEMASTLTTALASPEAKSAIVQLPDGSIVLVTPSDSNTTTTQTTKQSTQRERENENMEGPTSLQSQTANQFRRINVVKVHRFPSKSAGVTQKSITTTARNTENCTTRDNINSKIKEGSVPVNPGKKCTPRNRSVVGTQQEGISLIKNVSSPTKKAFFLDRDPTTLSQEAQPGEGTRNIETPPPITDTHDDDPVPPQTLSLQERNQAKDGDAVKDDSHCVKGRKDGQSKSEQTSNKLGSAVNDGSGIENVCDSPENTDVEMGGIVKTVTEVKEKKGSISRTSKAERTVRPKRNLSASHVKLTKMRLGRKTSVQLKGCLIPAIRQVYQTPPKLTSTNVFNVPDYMPSALDLKSETETKTEVEKLKRQELEPETAKMQENVDVDSVSSNKNRTKSNTGTYDKPPVQETNVKSRDEQSNDTKGDSKGNNSKFFLVKTSTGSYLVPMKRDKMGAMDLAKEAQESLEKYLTDSSGSGSNHEKGPPKISKQNWSPKKKGTSPAKPMRNTEEKATMFQTDEKNISHEDFDRRNQQEDDQCQQVPPKSEALERSASERYSEFAPPAKVMKLADDAESHNKPKTTGDRIKALREKLKKQQQEVEAVRQKQFLKTSLDEFDDL